MKRYDLRGMYPPLQMVSVPTGDWVLNSEAEYELSLLQAQLAEREATIVEQQALICDIIKTAEKAKDTPNIYTWEIGLGNIVALASQINLHALEAALKAERIKTLKALRGIIYDRQMVDGESALDVEKSVMYIIDKRVANELKEQS